MKKSWLFALALAGCGVDNSELFNTALFVSAEEKEHAFRELPRYHDLSTQAKLCLWEGRYMSEIGRVDLWEEYIAGLLDDLRSSLNVYSLYYRDPTGVEYQISRTPIGLVIEDPPHYDVDRVLFPPAQPEMAVCRKMESCGIGVYPYLPLNTPPRPDETDLKKAKNLGEYLRILDDQKEGIVAPVDYSRGWAEVAERAKDVHHYLGIMHELEQQAEILPCPETKKEMFPAYLPYEQEIGQLTREEWFNKAQRIVGEIDDLMDYPFTLTGGDYFGFGYGEDDKITPFDGPFDIRVGDNLVTRDGIIHLNQGDERDGKITLHKESIYVMDGSPTVRFGSGCVHYSLATPSYSVALEVAQRLNALFLEDTLLDEIETMAKPEQR